jgi:hypothetical protein
VPGQRQGAFGALRENQTRPRDLHIATDEPAIKDLLTSYSFRSIAPDITIMGKSTDPKLHLLANNKHVMLVQCCPLFFLHGAKAFDGISYYEESKMVILSYVIRRYPVACLIVPLHRLVVFKRLVEVLPYGGRLERDEPFADKFSCNGPHTGHARSYQNQQRARQQGTTITPPLKDKARVVQKRGHLPSLPFTSDSHQLGPAIATPALPAAPPPLLPSVPFELDISITQKEKVKGQIRIPLFLSLLR